MLDYFSPPSTRKPSLPDFPCAFSARPAPPILLSASPVRHLKAAATAVHLQSAEHLRPCSEPSLQSSTPACLPTSAAPPPYRWTRFAEPAAPAQSFGAKSLPPTSGCLPCKVIQRTEAS